MCRKKGQQLNYIRKESTHTPGTLRAIPSWGLNCLAKLTEKTSVHSEGVDKISPDHANALRNAGVAPPDFPTMGDLWSKQDEKVDTEKEPDVNKKMNRNVYICVAYSRYFSTSIHRVINRLKKSFNLSWMILWMSNHRFNNLAEISPQKSGGGSFSNI